MSTTRHDVSPIPKDSFKVQLGSSVSREVSGSNLAKAVVVSQTASNVVVDDVVGSDAVLVREVVDSTCGKADVVGS